MSDIKFVAGVWIPSTEEHLLPFLNQSARKSATGEGSYQLHTLAAFVNFVPPNRRRLVADVGANVGLWSLHFSKAFDRVIGYEPIKVNQKCFMLNTINHPSRPTKNVELRPYAVGAEKGEVIIEYKPDTTSGTQIASSDKAKWASEAEHYPVEVITLDSENLDCLDALKIDVEGYEYQVIKGAEETIRKFKPIICIEQKPWDVFEWGQYDAVELLISWGAKPVSRVVDDFILAWD